MRCSQQPGKGSTSRSSPMTVCSGSCATVRKAVSVARRMAFASTLLVVLSAACAFSQATPTPRPAKETQFTDQTAALLLDQFGAGLAEHSPKKTFSAIDFTKMSDGP